MRRQNRDQKKLRSKKKDKKKANKNDIPKVFPYYNRKRIQKLMRNHRKEEEIIKIDR